MRFPGWPHGRHRGACLDVEDVAFQEKVGHIEDTEERVLALHTEVCKGEVTSVEEGQDVERVITRSDVDASSYPCRVEQKEQRSVSWCRTLMCAKSEVTSVEEGHDVVRASAVRSDVSSSRSQHIMKVAEFPLTSASRLRNA